MSGILTDTRPAGIDDRLASFRDGMKGGVPEVWQVGHLPRQGDAQHRQGEARNSLVLTVHLMHRQKASLSELHKTN